MCETEILALKKNLKVISERTGGLQAKTQSIQLSCEAIDNIGGFLKDKELVVSGHHSYTYISPKNASSDLSLVI